MLTNPNINVTVISPYTYGALLVVSGLLAVYLPETNNRPLPVTINDAIVMSKKRKRAQTYDAVFMDQNIKVNKSKDEFSMSQKRKRAQTVAAN